MFSLKQDGGHYDDFQELNSALDLAELFLAGEGPDSNAVFTIHDGQGKALAVVTNNPIMGMFIKEEWGGSRGQHAVWVEDVEFDATDAIFLLTYEKLVALADNDDSSDEIGRKCIDWTGPCTVRIVDAICDYFQVECLEDIKPEAFAFVKNRRQPQPPITQDLTLVLGLTIQVIPGVDLKQLLANLECTVKSNMVGVGVVRCTPQQLCNRPESSW